jgi:tetratricopeptide (TPR) repeat protein
MTDPTFRQIRVFISSTFRDMGAERDHLVKFVFPQLRKLCESRGVVWGEVDLRWGITDEQSAEGQVLPLCLAEIQRCRPYFIGLLGERYGWIPEAIDPELIAQEPWLAEHQERSVTELEILHGVLKDPQMADKALFYFRDPAYLETLDADQMENYIEVPWREDIERYGLAEAQRRVAERQAKLAALKDRIRESGLLLKENYRDPQELGKWVLADLTAIINDLYPDGSQPDPLAQQAMLHEAFARERARVYIGGEKYYAQLDQHLVSSRQPLVVVGESGSGKSALLSNWGLKRRAEHPDELVLMHFWGSSAGSTDLGNMLARLMGELKERCEISQDLPQTEAELRQAFPNWLYMAAANHNVVLILDGLNQLEEGAQELDWLPLELPEKAGLVLSALPSRALDVINTNGWPSLNVDPLSSDERVQLVEDYLAQYSKQLSPERVARIIADPQSENPLALRVLLEELRQFGVHEQLDEVIDRYLAADSISEMYRLVLERCEADYEGERPGLVRDALSYIWAARRGLSEVELLELLGEGSEPLPHRLWSPLYLALEGGLVDRGGLLDFFHDYLRQAVETKYLISEKDKENAHIWLVGYFGLLEDSSVRKIDELPWQLSEAKQWGWLCEYLWNLEVFQALYEFNRYDLFTYWTLIELKSDIKRADAFKYVIENPAKVESIVLNSLFSFFFLSGNLEFALLLAKEMENNFHKEENLRGIVLSLNSQAAVYKALGKLTDAMELSKRAGRISRQLGSDDGLLLSLNNQANIHYSWGKLEKALELYKKQERISWQIGNHEGLQASLGNQALIMGEWGKMDKAMALMKEQEKICRKIGDLVSLSASLGNQAGILQSWGRLEEAMELHKEQEHLCRQMGNLDTLSISLGNQAGIQAAWGRLEEAMALHKDEEHLCRQLRNLSNLSISLGNQALVLATMGQLEESMALMKEQERLCRELDDPHGLANSLGNQAMILVNWNRFEEAMALHHEEERLYRQMGNMEGLGRTFGNQASILQKLGRLDEALKLFQQQELISREISSVHQLIFAIGQQAEIMETLNQYPDALKMNEELQMLCRGINDKRCECLAMISQGSILAKLGKRKDAIKIINDAHIFADQHGLSSMSSTANRMLGVLSPSK